MLPVMPITRPIYKTPMCLAAAAAVSIFSAATPVQAQITAKSLDDVVRVSFLSGWREAPRRHIAAVAFDLAPGWKTYWRSPGDGGLPTQLDWTGSENLSATSISWPHPTVFRDGGLRSIGYIDQLILPVIITSQQPGEIAVNLQLRFGVCEDICIPVQVEIDRILTTDITSPDPLITLARDKKVVRTRDFGITEISCTLRQLDDAHELNIDFQSPQLPGEGENLVIEATDPGIWVSEPNFSRDGTDISASTVMYLDAVEDNAIRLSEMRFTLISTEFYAEQIGCQPG